MHSQKSRSGLSSSLPTGGGSLLRKHGSHIFDGNQILVEGQGACHLHGRDCKVPPPPDIVCAGLPCKAFSRLRCTSGQSTKTSQAQHHPAFNAVQDFISYLSLRKPGVFWVEEVESFNSLKGRGQTETHLEAWCRAVTSVGFSVRVMRFCLSDWVENRRSRLLIVGCSKAHGGAGGAQWIIDAVERVVARRRMMRPVRIWELVDPWSVEEKIMRERELSACRKKACPLG